MPTLRKALTTARPTIAHSYSVFRLAYRTRQGREQSKLTQSGNSTRASTFPTCGSRRPGTAPGDGRACRRSSQTGRRSGLPSPGLPQHRYRRGYGRHRRTVPTRPGPGRSRCTTHDGGGRPPACRRLRQGSGLNMRRIFPRGCGGEERRPVRAARGSAFLLAAFRSVISPLARPSSLASMGRAALV